MEEDLVLKYEKSRGHKNAAAAAAVSKLSQ
jgi:hypothetical protein